MRVLVCGGRNYRNTAECYKLLDCLRANTGFDCLIEGDARGADRIAGYWARKRRLDNLKFPADWAAHGKAAGPIRNQRMIDEGKPDLVVAFPGGCGTADMVSRAKGAGIKVIKVKEDEG